MASISVVAVYPNNDQPHIVKRISGTHYTNQLKLRTGSDKSLSPEATSRLPAEQKSSIDFFKMRTRQMWDAILM